MFSESDIQSWVGSAVFADAQVLVAQGDVLSSQMQGHRIGGTVRRGKGRHFVKVSIVPNGVVGGCTCASGQGGRLCVHAIAVILRVLAHARQPAFEMVTRGGSRNDAPTPSPAQGVALIPPQSPPSKKPLHLTKALLVRWGGDAVYRRAEDLAKQGSVTGVQYRHPIISGSVWYQGTTVQSLRVTIKSETLIESNCPCYNHQGQGAVCEHMIALAIHAMKAQGDPVRLAAIEAERRRAQRLDSIDECSYIQRDINGARARLALNLPANFIKQFRSGEVVLTIRIILFRDDRQIVYKPEEFPPQQTVSVLKGDELVMALLEDVCEGPFSSQVKLKCDDFVAVLRLSQQTVLMHGHVRLKYIPEVLETHLHPTLNTETGELVVALETTHKGNFLVALNQGFLFTGHALYPLKKLLPRPYWDLYQQPIVIPQKGILSFLSTEIKQLAAFSSIDSSDISADDFTVTAGTPNFHLTLSGSLASIGATLEAVYPSGRFYARRQVPDTDNLYPDPDNIYHFYGRNATIESDALTLLASLGFFGNVGNAINPIVGDEHKVLNLLGSGVAVARRRGWKISILGTISQLYDNAEIIIPVVKIHNTAQAGFEVSYDYVAPEGTLTVSQVEIHKAIQRNEAFIRKGDRIAFIDINGIDSVQEIFRDCPVRATDSAGHFVVPPVYAPYVQASLMSLSDSGIDFDAPPDWEAKARVQNRTTKLSPVPLGELETVLRPYQKEGVYWLRFLEEGGFSGILADEMGLGKTLQTLTWLNLERIRLNVRKHPALIICPTSLVENWYREAEKFVPNMRCLILSGANRQERFADIPKADIVVTSYALIRRDSDVYAEASFSVIVLDEAQAIKNRTTQNAIAVKRLRADTKLVLSGTPVENGVSDLWSIMDFLMPAYLGSHSAFKDRYEEPITEGGALATIAQEKLRNKLHPFLLRRLKRDVAKDLPDKIQQISYCTLAPAQRRLYDRVLEQARSQMGEMVKEKGFAASRMAIFALLTKLRQICCDSRLLPNAPALKSGEESSAKLTQFMELFEEARSGGHRILLFSQFTSMLKLIAAELDEQDIPYCYLDGSTKDRLGQCTTFNQNPKIPIFLISLKAGGTGLNLTGANMVIHYDPWWNPAAEDQATDRAHRIGQKKTVYAIKLITQDTIEEKVLELQRKKQSLIQATIGGADATIAQSLSWDDVRKIVGL